MGTKNKLSKSLNAAKKHTVASKPKQGVDWIKRASLLVVILTFCVGILRVRLQYNIPIISEYADPEVVARVFADPTLEPILVVATKVFSTDFEVTVRDAGLPIDCVFTGNWTEKSKADMGMYHIPTYRKAHPEPVPALSTAWSLEGPHYYPVVKDLSHYNFTMTYKRSADFFTPYIPYDLYSNVRPARHPNTLIKGASMLISNCGSKNDRMKLAQGVKSVFPVYSLGQCMHNEDWPKGVARDNTQEVVGRYMFHLSFENGHSPEYVTEKLLHPILAGVIPVYYGTKDVYNFLPAKDAIIFAGDFATGKKLGQYLKKVANDPRLYWKHQAWRDKPIPQSVIDYLAPSKQPFVRRICRKIFELKYLEGKLLPPL